MIGLDVGDRRIGIAAADGLGLTAQGLPTIERRKPNEDFDRIIQIFINRGASKLIVGMPKNMDGSIGPQGEKVRVFTEALVHRMTDSGMGEPVVVYWDERLTTVAANRTLLEADLSRKKRKGAVDKLAAVFILQGYLDSEMNKRS
ncbi:MAG: Holliday junction resolvase RuvX [Peptococcaceae bacterium]|jgi:putative Holliday junction resolvase|nr:Holliday junction resolvase RuvX [Peptococcaceae bacterium]